MSPENMKKTEEGPIRAFDFHPGFALNDQISLEEMRGTLTANLPSSVSTQELHHNHDGIPF
jgi:hypothetical protein